MDSVANPFESGEIYQPPSPDPIVTSLVEELPFPVDALPGLLGETIQEISKLAQCPEALAGGSVLAAIALVAQALIDIRLPFGKNCPVSLYFLTIAASGERKTTADALAMRPLKEQRKKLEEEFKLKLADYQLAHKAWEIANRNVKNKNKNVDEIKLQLQSIGPEPKPPLWPVLTSKEATCPAIAKLFSIAIPTLGLFTSEAGEWLGGYNFKNENALATGGLLSDLWDQGLIERFRAGDTFSRLEGRRLSLHAMIQPATGTFFANHPILKDQGFLSRILPAFPKTCIGNRPYQELDFSESAILKRYEKRYQELFPENLESWPVDSNTGGLSPRVITLSTEAKEVYTLFYNTVEKQSGIEGNFSSISGLASKAAEYAARLAAVIAFFDNRDVTEVSKAHMEVATALIHYYLNEACRLSTVPDIDPKLIDAERIKQWISDRWTEDHVSVTELQQRITPTRLRNRERIIPLLEILVDTGFLIPVSDVTIKGKKRRGGFRIVGEHCTTLPVDG